MKTLKTAVADLVDAVPVDYLGASNTDACSILKLNIEQLVGRRPSMEAADALHRLALQLTEIQHAAAAARNKVMADIRPGTTYKALADGLNIERTRVVKLVKAGLLRPR